MTIQNPINSSEFFVGVGKKKPSQAVGFRHYTQVIQNTPPKQNPTEKSHTSVPLHWALRVEHRSKNEVLIVTSWKLHLKFPKFQPGEFRDEKTLGDVSHDMGLVLVNRYPYFMVYVS